MPDSISLSSLPDREHTHDVRTRSTDTPAGSDDPLAPLTTSAANPWDYAKAAHLLRRTVVGATDAEIRRAVADGLDATVERLMQPWRPSTEEIEAWVGTDVQIRHEPQEGPEAEEWHRQNIYRAWQLARWWLKAIADSPISIQEKMTLFWHNHFAADQGTICYAQYMYEHLDLLRRKGLGSVKQLVHEVTVDMGMLIFLDGWENCKIDSWTHVNENYSRELLELYTIGLVDRDGRPNYTQEDVMQGARALTGWTYDESTVSELHRNLRSRYYHSHWDETQKTYLGRTGNWKAHEVVEIIFDARRDQAARFICAKLYRFFVDSIVDEQVVDAMAETMKNNGWEVRPVLEQLLRSGRFYDPSIIGALEKGHVEYYLGLIRGLGIDQQSVPDFLPFFSLRAPDDLRERLRALGGLPMYPPNVAGWPGGRAWITTSTLPVRLKFALDLISEGIIYKTSRLYVFDAVDFARTFPEPNDPRQLCRDIGTYLLGAPPVPQEEEILLAALLDGGPDYEWSIDDPEQHPQPRIRKLLAAIVRLSKFQLH